MKKFLVSLLGICFISGAAFVVAESDPVTDGAQAAGVALAKLLNQKDEAYVKMFYSVLDGLIKKVTEAGDVTKMKVANTIKDVLLRQVKYSPYEEVEEVKAKVLACYDNSVEIVICTMEYNPMCGKDGATYGNPCAMNAAAVEMAHEGACIAGNKPEVCPSNYAPVCGSDGQTYGNFCSLQALGKGAMYLFDGTCEDNEERLTCVEINVPAPAEKPCTREYVPVCGKDGVTYANVCMADNAGVEYVEGECG